MNRREVLAGMALASASVAIPAAALGNTMAQPNRAAWDRALASLKAAHKASDDFEPTIWRILEAYKAAVKKVPNTTVEVYGRSVSTADSQEVSWARHGEQNLRYVEVCAYEGVKGRHKLAEAANARDAKIAAIDKRLGRTAANNHHDALSEAITAAEDVLLKMPAPDGEALLWKVDRLYCEGQGIWAPGFESQTHADLRRLLSTGRA